MKAGNENVFKGDTDNKKIVSLGWIVFATYFGGPLAATYFLYKNFKVFKEMERAVLTIKVGVLATFIIFASIAFIPEAVMDKIPNSVIPIFYTMAVYMIVHQYQEKQIGEYFEKGGLKESGWKVTGISILALLITVTFTVIFGLVFSS